MDRSTRTIPPEGKVRVDTDACSHENNTAAKPQTSCVLNLHSNLQQRLDSSKDQWVEEKYVL